MTGHSLTFDAIAEARPGDKWAARFAATWPAYKAWFIAGGGASGPDRATCEDALARHMPELVPVHRDLVRLSGNDDLAARFLSTWCPPAYLGGCSIAAIGDAKAVRLIRNYDLSPDLNEGLLLRSEWTGMPVMGMIEFLWGLSDGINAAGLSVALAFGGRSDVKPGFGITTILRYIMETCATVEQGLAVLGRVPSHMAYNIALADRHGATASVELQPGGGMRQMTTSVATNHQHGPERAERPGFTATRLRHEHLRQLVSEGLTADALGDAFLKPPLYHRRYAQGFGTLFTAVYDPHSGTMTLRWPGRDWVQSLDAFREGRRVIRYDTREDDAEHVLPDEGIGDAIAGIRAHLPKAQHAAFDRWSKQAQAGTVDWAAFGRIFAPDCVE
jgi:predicted choloylglycine hydrolase